jgi:hypothetical protein
MFALKIILVRHMFTLASRNKTTQMSTSTLTCACLGMGCALCRSKHFEIDPAHVALQRADLHERARVSAACSNFTHVDASGNRFRLTPEESLLDQQYFCMLVLCKVPAVALAERAEKCALKMHRVDAALAEFLSSDCILKQEGARVTTSAFANVFRKYSGLEVSQHAITQACRRAGLKTLSSHSARQFLDLKLT